MLLAFILLIWSAECAKLPEEINLVVGQVMRFSLDANAIVSDAADEGAVPSWMEVSDGELVGIPEEADVGSVLLKITQPAGAAFVKVLVKEETKNPCGSGGSSFWVEKPISESTLSERIRVAESIAKTADIPLQDIRVQQWAYAHERARKIHEYIGDQQPAPYVILFAVPCNTDYADYVLAVAEGDNVLVTRAEFIPRGQREQPEDGVFSAVDGSTNEPLGLEEVFTHPTTYRTTRAVSDQAPIKLASISSIHCQQGTLCVAKLPSNLFMDKEDGSLKSLELSVEPLGLTEKLPYAVLDKHNLAIKVLPIHVGQFELKVNARDSAKQLNSAPFSVVVSPSGSVSHVFAMNMFVPRTDEWKASANMIHVVERLAQVHNSTASEIRVVSVEPSKNGLLFSWTNNTLSAANKCKMDDIQARYRTMVIDKNDRVRMWFTKAMERGAQVDTIKLILRGVCESSSTVSTTPSSSPSREDASSSSFPLTLLLVIIALFLFLLLLIAIICCLCRRNTRNNEYLSKGTPVVFPDEVEDDMENTPATAPMLVKEERPPIRLTQHENPLYKPPPPLSSASPRPTPTPLGASTQRLPPPYVPP